MNEPVRPGLGDVSMFDRFASQTSPLFPSDFHQTDCRVAGPQLLAIPLDFFFRKPLHLRPERSGKGSLP